MKAVLIGPLPPPTNGCSYANEVLLRSPTGISFRTVDTATPELSGRQGENFSLRKAIYFLRTYLALPRIFFSDVVYLTPGQTFFGILKYAPFICASLLLRKPYVIHLHGNHLGTHYEGLRGIKRSCFHFLVSKASAGIVLSKSLRRNFSGLLPPAKVFVVKNFAGDDLICEPLVQKKNDELRIIFLSNLMKEKGVIELLDALLILKSRSVPFRAVIAGAVDPEVGACLAERLELLGASVEYLGSIKGELKRSTLVNSNVFVLPTYYPMEGQPISLLEGLATGNIIVTTAHAGIPDIIGPANGYIVATRDSKAIAETLSLVAADLPAQVARFSSNNVKYAAECFSERSFSQGIANVLAGVVTRRADSGASIDHT